MKFSLTLICCSTLGLILAAVLVSSGLGGGNQVTGPVLAVTDTSITLRVDRNPWTISRDATTQVTGNLKVGSQVTIRYHLVADTVTVK